MAMEPEMGRLTETDEPPAAGGTGSMQKSQADIIIRKVCVHLLPKFFLLTVTSYVDRCAADPLSLSDATTHACGAFLVEHDTTRLI